jgi:integral membrane protein (TIGR01906 family)
MTQTRPPIAHQPRPERGREYRLARIVLVLCIPPVLLLSPLYLLATNAFVRYEYSKPGFPPADFYNPDERLSLAEATVHYLRSSAGPDFLWGLSSQGQEVYNPREVQHLVDVKRVMRGALWIHGICALLCIAAIAFLWRWPQGRASLWRAVYQGCLLLLMLLVVVGVLALTNFDVFFVLFHRLFFHGDTWLFAYSDTLIQLFPVPFWMDATAGLAVPAVAASVVVGTVAYILSRRVRVD